MALKYRGKDPNTEWIGGVPARDLSDEDIKALGLNVTELAKTPLYERVKPKAERKPKAPKPAPTAESATTEGAE